MSGDGDELHGVAHCELSRMRQVDRRKFAHATRLGGEHQDMLTEEGCLRDRMGDEQNRRARSSQMRRSSSFSLSRVISSSAPKGSSIKRMRGLQMSARAIATRWRMPPESSWGSACSRPSRPTMARSASGSTVCSILAEPPPTSSGRRTLSSAVRQGRSVAS